MDSALIRNWNKTVKSNDLVYVLGDFTMRGTESYSWFQSIIDKLNGEKILILGNHDKLSALKYVELGFKSAHTSLSLDNKRLFLIHDPSNRGIAPKNYKILCGHVHNLFVFADGEPTTLNVGVDIWDYKPISLEQVINTFNNSEKKSKPAVFATKKEYATVQANLDNYKKKLYAKARKAFDKIEKQRKTNLAQ